MAHEHSVFNTDELFLINPDTRTITQQSGKSRLMQYDHNSERFEFQIPRYIEGHDMSLCNDIKVNYINLSSRRDEQTNGPYVVKDMQIDPKDSNNVVFSWLISRNATKYAGTLNFNISFRCLTGAIIDYAWYTDIFKGITVGAGIENNGSEYSEDHIDILEQWKQEVLAGLDSVDGVVTSVNGIGPDESGNILIDIPTDEHINSLIEDKFDTNTVKTVNGVYPDESGNVELDVQESFSGSWNDLTDKPFYVERQNVTHDSVTVGIYNLGYATLPFEFFPGVGESYTIIWDGTTYECSAVTATIDDGEEVIAIGNTTFFGGNENTNVPVSILSRHGSAVVYSSDSGEHTISLIGYELIPHKIPSEYIDRNPIIGVIDSSYYNFRYLNPARGASISEVRKAAKEGDRDIIIRLDLDNWQGTLQYMGLTTVSTDDSDYASALLFSTIKANNVSINTSDETVNGTMQFEYWYAFLEPTEGPPADAFVNCQFAEINLAPGTKHTGSFMRVNEDGLWSVEKIDIIQPPTTAKVGQVLVVKSVDENGKPIEWETADSASSKDDTSYLTLVDKVTGVTYSLEVIDGKLTMTGVTE